MFAGQFPFLAKTADDMKVKSPMVPRYTSPTASMYLLSGRLYCRTPGTIHIAAWIPGLPGVVQCTATAVVDAGLDSSRVLDEHIVHPPCFYLCSSICFSLFSNWGAPVSFQGQIESFPSLGTPA